MPEASSRIAPRRWLPAAVAIGLSFAAGSRRVGRQRSGRRHSPNPPPRRDCRRILHRRHQAHRPHHAVPRLRRRPLQLRLRQGLALPALECHLRQRPVPQPQELLHRPVLRPLPPGGLPPVAPVRALQQLPRPLVSQKRQHAHRRERACSSRATAKAATTPSPCSPAICRRACPKSAPSRTKASPAPPATPSSPPTPPAPAATSWASRPCWSTKTARPSPAPSPTPKSWPTSTAIPRP